MRERTGGLAFIGVGGVMTAEDVYEKKFDPARLLVQLYTGLHLRRARHRQRALLGGLRALLQRDGLLVDQGRSHWRRRIKALDPVRARPRTRARRRCR